MSQQTTSNGHTHIHHDWSAAAPPESSPLDKAARAHFGAPAGEVGRRTKAVEVAVFDNSCDLLEALASVVRCETGEQDERIIKYAIAQGLTRIGAAGQFALMTQDRDASIDFGYEIQQLVIQATLARAGY